MSVEAVERVSLEGDTSVTRMAVTDASPPPPRYRHPSDWQTCKVVPFDLVLFLLLRGRLRHRDDRSWGAARVS